MTPATQPRLFADQERPVPDLAAALETRDAAIDAIEANADMGWKAQALTAVKTVARRAKTFTVDDVWPVLDTAGVPRPNDSRAMGPVLRKAWREGIIRPTGRHVRSAQVQCHGNLRQEWESLLYGR